jgi:hypothetical protein
VQKLIAMQNIAENSIYLPWVANRKTNSKVDQSSRKLNRQILFETSCFSENRQRSPFGEYETVSTW